MLFTFDQQKLTLSQLTSGKIKQNNLSELDCWVVNFIQEWFNGKKSFTIQTSGSTGIPSNIELSREKLIYSATTSLDFLDPNHHFRTALLCISPKHIGGMMVLIRAILRNLDIRVTAPSANLGSILSEDHFDLVSLVPLQVQTLINQNSRLLESFNTILIGGAPLKPQEIESLTILNKSRIFHTYGMTETASHIALKNLSNNSKIFETLGDLKIDVDQRGCLKVKGTVTDQNWIQTNDIVHLTSQKSFEWMGRADFVINSGGIKIHPETLENNLSSQIKIPFFVASLPDERLGERLILVAEGTANHSFDFQTLDKYQRPKEVYFIDRFIYTDTSKINRKATLELLKTRRGLS